MSAETKVVKGGFRATLALIVSIIALILAIVAFNRTGGQGDLNSQIKDLQTKMEKMKQDSAQQVNKMRDETAKVLEKLGQVIKKKTEGEQ
jgi:predicted Holliday junction resolvase-like endonuclease